METPKYAIFVALVISSMWAMSSMAQPSSSGISSACRNVLVTLSPCLNYITGNSSTPSSSCCTQLGTVVSSSPQCLCEVLNNGGASGLAASLNINTTQALTLPNACNLQTPPLSRCNAVSPAGSPIKSPTISTPGGGSKTSPTTGESKTIPTTGESSDAKMPKIIDIPLMLAVLFASHFLAF